MDHTYAVCDPHNFNTDELPGIPIWPNSTLKKNSSKREWCYCYVPLCPNTARNSSKLYCRVPLDKKRRKQWLSKARRTNSVSDNSDIFACEDHFDIENDVDNLIAVRMGFSQYLKLKPNVEPRFFDCQTNRPKVAQKSKGRPLLEKRKKQELIETAIESSKKKKKPNEDENQEVVLESSDDILEDSNFAQIFEQNTIFSKDIATQTENLTSNKKVQFNVNTTFGKRRGTNTEGSQTCQSVSILEPKPRIPLFPLVYSSCSSSSEDENHKDDSFNLSVLSACSEILVDDENEKRKTRERILNIIKEKPLSFLGLPPENIFVCNEIASSLQVEILFIYMCFMKIRLDLSFDVLAVLFAYSSSHISRNFNKYIRGIAALLNSLIEWPTMELVKINIPIPYRFKYKNVYCIIDCLEIEIQKPTDPQYQSATWSEYKKCNTAKYLVACTPQGFINFISSGYGGRITDAKIIELSGFLDYLKPGMAIMADRGFKNVDSLLVKKECTLVRPPSVYATVKPTKEEVKETKRIASLRVIIENVIGRIRHFKLLAPHSGVPIKNLDQLDYAIQVACGLINLQYPVRKKF